MIVLKLIVCIVLRVLGQVQGFRLTGFNILFSNRYMFRSYAHLQADGHKTVIRTKHVAVTE
jgi:hypothetical protein